MWACEAQIPRGAHRIQEGANAPPPPLNETLGYMFQKEGYVRERGCMCLRKRGMREKEGVCV